METSPAKTRIMVVDDEVNLTRLLKTNLEKTNRFDVRTANRAKDAVPLAKIFKPEFVLLDVMMPDGDGGNIAAGLRKEPEMRGVPITFLTAAIKRAELGAAEGVIGGSTFIAKPVSLSDLVLHIQRRLAEQKPAAAPVRG